MKNEEFMKKFTKGEFLKIKIFLKNFKSFSNGVLTIILHLSSLILHSYKRISVMEIKIMIS